MVPDQASRVQRGRRNQWHFKPHQTWEKDIGLQPGFLWRCSRSRWKQGFEEFLCSGGDTRGPESKWLIFKHAYEKSVCVCAQFKMFSLMSLQVRVKYSLLDAVLCALECGRAHHSLACATQHKPLTRYLSYTTGSPLPRLVVRASLYSVF